jgi:hypothetical protein
MSKFELKVYKGTKPKPNVWTFEIVPYNKVNKYLVAKRLITLYPDLQIIKINVTKTLKRCKVHVTTNREAPWMQNE